jgi:hypothetical protein
MAEMALFRHRLRIATVKDFFNMLVGFLLGLGGIVRRYSNL